jgi:hypothetical protein
MTEALEESFLLDKFKTSVIENVAAVHSKVKGRACC